MIRTRAVTAALLLALPSVGMAQSTVDGFRSRTFRSGDLLLPYRLFVPTRIESTGKYPLIVYLHGSGGAGSDNLKQITVGNHFGTHAWTTSDVQTREPVFVLAPQAAENEQWASVTDDLSPYASATMALVQLLETEFPIDADRIVITGQSRGGFGVWDLAAKRPQLFAAALPLCGSGDASAAAGMRSLPIWAFHGAQDETVPVLGSREMVDALRSVDALIRYTEYPDLGHAIWQRAYGDTAVINWALRQRRHKRTGAENAPTSGRAQR